MAKVSVDVQSWSRFSIDGLTIAPSLVGKVHGFRYAGREVEIRIPTPQVRDDEHPSIVPSALWARSGRPVGFDIKSVDVVVDLKRRRRVLPIALERVDCGLFSDTEQKRFNTLVEEGMQTASQAFDRWVRILRWKSNSCEIGQPRIYGHQSGWSTYLQELASEKRFYCSACVLCIELKAPISPQIWRAVGSALQNPRVEPPVWFDFLFDAERRIAIGDLHSALISLAIACETLLRALLARYLRRRDDEVIRLMNQINIGRVLDRWKRLFGNWHWGRNVDIKQIKHLFDLRNAIAHRGEVRNLKSSECAALAKAVHAFVNAADKKVK